MKKLRILIISFAFLASSGLCDDEDVGLTFNGLEQYEDYSIIDKRKAKKPLIISQVHGETFRRVCTSENGFMEISPGANILAAMDEKSGKKFGGSKISTVFIHSAESFGIRCGTLADNESVVITEKKYVEFGINERVISTPGSPVAETVLALDELEAINDVNYKNVSLVCESVDTSHIQSAESEVLCQMNLIVIRRTSEIISQSSNNSTDPSAGGTNTTGSEDASTCVHSSNVLRCNVRPWLEELDASRGRGLFEARVYGEARHANFEKIIRYSYYDKVNSTWVHCDEMNANLTTLKPTFAVEQHTKYIKCPTENIIGKEPQPVIVRVEVRQKTGVSVGLPILSGGGSNEEVNFSYFSVLLNSTVGIEETETGGVFGDHLVIAIVFGVLLVLLLIALFATFFHIYRHKRKNVSGASSEAGGEGYVDMAQNVRYSKGWKIEKKDGEYAEDDDDDLMSNRTEMTLDYIKGLVRELEKDEYHDISETGESDEANKSVKYLQIGDKAKVRKVLKRILSGDPSKLNPGLTLNHQIANLSYDDKFKIDRSNFEIGQILGSGNFGAVYVGKAFGLFHPGSETKVAVKTVNNALDVTQFSSLIDEMKIMTNLDPHLNLVNLMGSCDSNIDDLELWLLLEYCPHGDMRTFLHLRRPEIVNNLNGLVNTELDERMFLRWCYHIAKGMQYLESRRIMHGDLAARNILIGEGYVAKVSDFGLSKCMYNYKNYKKERRNYVPWKWMALEFLNTGVFNLKSDIWSYGVVVWEMFSLGAEPYAELTNSYEDAVNAIKNGYRLPFPDEDCLRKSEYARKVYDKIVFSCWKFDADSRPSFSSIVDSLESQLDCSEVVEYSEKASQYKVLKELLMDKVTASKRSTVSPRSSNIPPSFLMDGEADEQRPQQPAFNYQRVNSIDKSKASSDYQNFEELKSNGYQKFGNLVEDQQPQLQPNGYRKISEIQEPPLPNGYHKISNLETTQQLPNGYHKLGSSTQQQEQSNLNGYVALNAVSHNQHDSGVEDVGGTTGLSSAIPNGIEMVEAAISREDSDRSNSGGDSGYIPLQAAVKSEYV